MVLEKQLKLKIKTTSQLTHGGEVKSGRVSASGTYTTGKRKVRRPIIPRTPLHITMRAAQARGKWSLLHSINLPHVDRIVRTTAKNCDVHLMEFANVGNHLHILLRGRTLAGVIKFLREVTGRIAMTITGARKSNPLRKRFWDHLAFSRVVPWGRALTALRKYVTKNVFEAAGLLSNWEKPHVQVIAVDVVNLI